MPTVYSGYYFIKSWAAWRRSVVTTMFLAALCLAAYPPLAHAVTEVEITRGVVEPYPIAITLVSPMELPEKCPGVLRAP